MLKQGVTVDSLSNRKNRLFLYGVNAIFIIGF
ncbi:unannotated protein [freshwater metagenome]|uniref:Unannotated protein n=1 Tax=freshwater metagenome TaxID=449393 RepID=A0A6J7EK87_9ZZZZ